MPAQNLLQELAVLAGAADGDACWPEPSWNVVKEIGALHWSLPQEDGGTGLAGPDLLDCYEQLAGACLTTCFILSQRDAACRRIRDSENSALARELLPPLARGDCFATVGLSQLSTSRQHGKPALVGRLEKDKLILDGSMPWVTGAVRADHFVTGAALDDGRQILTVLPAELPGVCIGPPLPLMALQGSMTAEVSCQMVEVDRRWLLAGPAERIMATGKGGTGGLETSCLALGLAGAAVDYLHGEAKQRADLGPMAQRLEESRQGLRDELHRLSQSGTADAAVALRARANAFVLHATQSALTASKGTGFLRDHPAQRWARQALFFLVWSCPRPAAEATLAYLTPRDEFACP